MTLRILVCGGRDYTDRQTVFDVLDRLHRDRGIACIIHGGARGADMLAGEWAARAGIQVDRYPADWETYKHAAGPIRNQQMLDQGKPDGVVAFPGGRGTADMKRRASAAGLGVWEPCGFQTVAP
jgi:hypothetical protein